MILSGKWALNNVITKSMRISCTFMADSSTSFTQRLPFQLRHLDQRDFHRLLCESLNFDWPECVSSWCLIVHLLIEIVSEILQIKESKHNDLWSVWNTPHILSILFLSISNYIFSIWTKRFYVVRYFGLEVHHCSSVRRQQWSTHTHKHSHTNTRREMRCYRLTVCV